MKTGLNESHKPRFMIAMNAMSTVYGSQPLDKPRLALFFEALQDLSIDAIERSTQEIMKNESRFPVPKIIREYADKARYQLPAPPVEKINLFTTEPASEYGKASLQLMRDMFADKFKSRIDYLLKAIVLTEQHGQDATELEAEWNKLKFSEVSAA